MFRWNKLIQFIIYKLQREQAEKLDVKFSLRRVAICWPQELTGPCIHLKPTEVKGSRREEYAIALYYLTGNEHCGIHDCLITQRSSMRLFFTPPLP